MKKHNKPEWVEDIEKAKSDLQTKQESQFNLLRRLYLSLTAVDTELIKVFVYFAGIRDIDLTPKEYDEQFIPHSGEQYINVNSNCRSPHTKVVQYLTDWESKGVPETETREVEIKRKLKCHLTEADDYCFEFFTDFFDCLNDNKTIVSSQLIDASNEEILEVDKVYDIYKWLTYNTDNIPLIGEVKTIKKLIKRVANQSFGYWLRRLQLYLSFILE